MLMIKRYQSLMGLKGKIQNNSVIDMIMIELVLKQIT